MRVRWHGHSCFEFGDGDITVVVDPHDGRSIGIKPPAVSADVVLMTHNHYDHNAVRVVKGNHKDFMMTLGDFDACGLRVTGFPSFHDRVGSGAWTCSSSPRGRSSPCPCRRSAVSLKP